MRVENLGSNVDAWYEAEGEGSSTYDVCHNCYDILEEDPHAFNHKLKPYQYKEPQGEDGWGGDVCHPEYDEEGSYYCACCGNKLFDEVDS